MPALSLITHSRQKLSWMRIPQGRIPHRTCAGCRGLARSGGETPSEDLQPLEERPGLLYPQTPLRNDPEAEDGPPGDMGARIQAAQSQAWLVAVQGPSH